MNDASLRKLTGVILILTPVAFNVFFTLLSMTFAYPDILRELHRLLRLVGLARGVRHLPPAFQPSIKRLAGTPS